MKKKTKTAPHAAIDKIGHALQRLIHAFAEAPDDAKIFMVKWDIKDGFWRLCNQIGDKWNFCYVLPQRKGATPNIVVPTSLQIGWVESPPYFCAASETARNVAAQYMNTPIGSLPQHKFQHLTETNQAFQDLPERAPKAPLSTVLEVYVNDYIVIATPASQEQLQHVATAVMSGVHDVFTPDDDNDKDPISLSKILKGEGEFAMEKDCLGFYFDGEPYKHTMWYEAAKRDELLLILHGWLRASGDRNHEITFNLFHLVAGKLKWAFIAIPQGNGLLSPLNRLVAKEPKYVYLHRNKPLL